MAKKPKPARRPSKGTGHAFPIRIKLERKHDYWGEPIRRPFSDAVLQRCLRVLVLDPRGCLMRSCRETAGGDGAPQSVEIFHFQEGAYQMIFRVRVAFHGGQRATVAFALSKSPGRVTRVAQAEHRNLQRLHARVPEHIVRPLHGGLVRMDVDGGRPRNLFGYCTEWLPDYHELGVNRRMCFFINEKPFHHFDAAATRQIKKQMIEICMQLYDPARQAAIEVPLIGAGDFVATRPARGRPVRLKLIAVRKILTGMSEEEAHKLYWNYEGDWGGRLFRLRP